MKDSLNIIDATFVDASLAESPAILMFGMADLFIVIGFDLAYVTTFVKRALIGQVVVAASNEIRYCETNDLLLRTSRVNRETLWIVHP